MTTLASRMPPTSAPQLQQLAADIFRIAMGRHISLHGDFSISRGGSGLLADQFDAAVVDECGLQIVSCAHLQPRQVELTMRFYGSLSTCFGNNDYGLKCRVLFVPGGREQYDDADLFTDFEIVPEPPGTVADKLVDDLAAHKSWLLLTNPNG